MSSFYTVTKKELQDHFNSWRFIILLLIMVAAIVYVYYAAAIVRAGVGASSENIFLQLFTTAAFNTTSSMIPASFLSLMAVILPLGGIILGLDAINSEKNDGTLSRLMSQPIYRDNIINAKFLAGLITIAVVLTSTLLLVSGMGLWKLGIPPSVEEIWRLFFFLVIGIIYAGFWLGLAVLFSTLFKQVAVSAILAIAIWVFFAFFFPLIINSMQNNALNASTAEEGINQIQASITVARISPIYLFNEAMSVVLFPILRSSSQLVTVIFSDARNYLMATPLSFWQSLLAVWPQIIVTLVLTSVCFAISYIKFMFEEIRAL